MAFEATVIQVMIASPGDVIAERDIIRTALGEWNNLNTAAQRVVLLPVGWDTHSSADLSGRPQEIINGRLLEKCDLLVGVFWTRLGTPTGDHASGTVEEIKRHVAAGRTAMVYFSARPLAPGTYDTEQYDKVLEFRAWCMERGIISTFDSHEDFLATFRRELQITLRENPYLNSLTLSESPIETNDQGQYKTVQFSELSIDMLKNAAEDEHGMILVRNFIGGTHFNAGRKSYDVSSGQREVARHQAAVEELVNYQLIEDVGYKGEIFRVTNAGYEVVDSLKGAST